MLSSEPLPPTKGPHPGGQKSQGSALWSLVLFVWDPQGVLPPGGSGLLSNGHHGVALSLHVLMQSLPMKEISWSSKLHKQKRGPGVSSHG